MSSVDTFMGDCLDAMSLLQDEIVDLVVCDLPYGSTKCAWDTQVPLKPLWEQYRRLTKPNAAILLFAQTPFDKVLGASNLEMLRYEWIWEKPGATGFFNAKKAPLKAHENILVFYRNLPTYNPIMTHGHQRKVSGRKEIGSQVYGKGVKKTNYDSTSRYPRSIQSFSRDPENLHPTQKPVALLEYLIATYSNPGDVVLDNCMGSGTTGVAAVNLGRSFIGIEKDSSHYLTAKDRIQAACAQKSLFEVSA